MERPEDRTAGLSPPTWLSASQQAVWQTVRPRLPETMSAQQSQVLESYAVERTRWHESEVYLQEHGDVLVMRTDKGDVKAVIEAPQIKIAARAQDRMLKLGAQLGLGKTTR